MLRPFLLSLLSVCGALASPALAQNLTSGVPVSVYDESKLTRDNELVALSVPIAQSDAVLDPTTLGVFDPAGKEVPAQWRVLTRWGGGPQETAKPIKFALARFQVSLTPAQTKTYTVRRRKAADGAKKFPLPAIQLHKYGTWLGVDTGKALFHLSPESFSLFGNVFLDLNGNGKYEEAEQLVKVMESVGPVTVDRMGGVYAGHLNPGASFTIEEQGPLYLCIRVDGLHQPVGTPHIGRDFLGYTTRLEFSAGSAAVRVQHALKNSYLTNPLGAIGFARHFLHVKLAGIGPWTAVFGPDPATTSVIAQGLGSGKEAFLLQDSPGGTYWNQPGTSYSGFRVYHSNFSYFQPEQLPGGSPLASGQRAEGWLDLRGPAAGMMVALRYPWQNYPYALRGYYEGSVVADLWPAEFSGLHWLDDAQRKAHELVYVFHGPSATFNARLEAQRQTVPLRPIVAADYLRATKAWGDHGDLRKVTLTSAQTKAEADSRLQSLFTGMESQGGMGWMNFGEPVWAKNTHSTGSPRNKLTYFDRFVSTGNRSWFESSEVFALHSMDLRTYHIDGFKKEQFPGVYLYEGVPHWNSKNFLGRDAIPASLDAHKAGIPTGGHGWNGYDSEHFVVDDLYEYYLLTGSQHALDAMKKIAEGALTWPFVDPNKSFTSSRTIGWTLRGLMKMYAVTGDARLLQQATNIVTSVDKFRGKKPSPKTGHTYFYLARQIYGGTSHNMTTDYDLPWQIAVGMYGLGLYARDTNSAQARVIVGDLQNYLLDYCVQSNGAFVEALEVDNHTKFNPKPDNNGVNTWIASALGVSYRITGRPEALARAKQIFQSNHNSFTAAFISGSDYYHWYHTVGTLLNQ